MQTVTDFVAQALADACNVKRPALRGNTLLSELGFDSMSATALTFAIESNYGRELGQDTIVRLYEAATVDDVTALIGSFLAANNISPVTAA